MIQYISRVNTSINGLLSSTEDVSKMPKKIGDFFFKSTRPCACMQKASLNAPIIYIVGLLPCLCKQSQEKLLLLFAGELLQIGSVQVLYKHALRSKQKYILSLCGLGEGLRPCLYCLSMGGGQNQGKPAYIILSRSLKAIPHNKLIVTPRKSLCLCLRTRAIVKVKYQVSDQVLWGARTFLALYRNLFYTELCHPTVAL